MGSQMSLTSADNVRCGRTVSRYKSIPNFGCFELPVTLIFR
jgi:hypothetical protein